jgi:hypothetical protein
MTAARRRVLIVLAIVLAAGAAVALALSRPPGPSLPPRPAGEKPALLLLTSLPLMFGEDFSVDGGGSPALSAIEKRYRIVPISVSSPAELAKGRLLLMAHPLAQPAEELVALDRWVRGGGRVLLLADPLLEWPSKRPLGDRLRPPPMFADTGLLTHWGLKLDAPDERGPRTGKLGDYEVLTASPGTLHGKCAVGEGGLAAHCSIGKGKATVVADADFLGVQHLDGPTAHNLDALLAELDRLDSQPSP